MMGLNVDSEKQMHIVDSYSLLQFLGDVGGFFSAQMIVVTLLSSWISGSMLKASMVQKYIQERRRTEKKDEYVYSPIKISICHAFFESFIGWLLALTCFCKSCKCFKIKRDQMLLDKGFDQI